jgi:hypothetical protein
MVADSRLLVVAGDANGERIAQLWEMFEGTGSLQAVLDELARSGISTMPEFALLRWDTPDAHASEGLHLIVRGQLRITTFGSVPQTFDGSGVSTWNERTVAGATAFRIDTSLASSGTPDLPLLAGCAWIESIGSSPAAVEPAAVAAESTGHSSGQPPARVPVREAVHEPPVSLVQAAPSETTMIEFPREEVEDLEPVPSAASAVHGGDDAPPTVQDSSGYDYLFGETIARTVEDAAVRDSEGDADETGVAAPDAAAGDHDGRTAVGLSRAERQAARRARAGDSSPVVAGPKLLIVFSAGTTEAVDGPMVIGRAPSVSQVSGDRLPRLVTITGSDQDISRNHLQVTVEGGTMVVTDLHSRNGTQIVLPGRAPQQLRAGEPTAVIVGTMVDLGAGVTFTVREE